MRASGERRPGQLSGGQQQRVGLARALAVDPEVLLFDEPFSALDPLIRRDMQEEVIRLHREEGRTMIFITHDLSEALRLGDRIALMRDGAIVQLGTPEEIVATPGRRLRTRLRPRRAPRAGHLRAPRHAPGRRRRGRGRCRDHRPDTLVADAIETVARSGALCRVVEDGRTLGVVDHASLLDVVAGLDKDADGGDGPRTRTAARSGRWPRMSTRPHTAATAAPYRREADMSSPTLAKDEPVQPTPRRPRARPRAPSGSALGARPLRGQPQGRRPGRRRPGRRRQRPGHRLRQPGRTALDVDVKTPLNDLDNWLVDNRETHPIFLYFLLHISNLAETSVDGITSLFDSMGWVGVTVVGTLIAWAAGGADLSGARCAPADRAGRLRGLRRAGHVGADDGDAGADGGRRPRVRRARLRCSASPPASPTAASGSCARCSTPCRSCRRSRICCRCC